MCVCYVKEGVTEGVLYRVVRRVTRPSRNKIKTVRTDEERKRKRVAVGKRATDPRWQKIGQQLPHTRTHAHRRTNPAVTQQEGSKRVGRGSKRETAGGGQDRDEASNAHRDSRSPKKNTHGSRRGREPIERAVRQRQTAQRQSGRREAARRRSVREGAKRQPIKKIWPVFIIRIYIYIFISTHKLNEDLMRKGEGREVVTRDGGRREGSSETPFFRGREWTERETESRRSGKTDKNTL